MARKSSLIKTYMKLLDRKEINMAKASERRLEVEEGRKLATRVDSLRELFSKEQGSLAKYRDETVKVVIQDVVDAIARLDQINQECKAAEERRDIAMLPLTEKRKELDDREAKIIESEKITLDARNEAETNVRETEHLKKDQESAVREAQILQDDAKKTNNTAKRLEKAANEILKNAEKVKINATDEATSLLDDVYRIEAECEARENAVKLREDKVAAEDERLSARERAIIDREESLDREIKRQNK